MATIIPRTPVLGEVPAELLDPAHATWRDPDLYDAWCQRHGIEGRSGRTWAERFQGGRDAWAVAEGLTIRGSLHVDRAKLTALGIPHVGALARAQARAEADRCG